MARGIGRVFVRRKVAKVVSLSILHDHIQRIPNIRFHGAERQLDTALQDATCETALPEILFRYQFLPE